MRPGIALALPRIAGNAFVSGKVTAWAAHVGVSRTLLVGNTIALALPERVCGRMRRRRRAALEWIYREENIDGPQIRPSSLRGTAVRQLPPSRSPVVAAQTMTTSSSPSSGGSTTAAAGDNVDQATPGK